LGLLIPIKRMRRDSKEDALTKDPMEVFMAPESVAVIGVTRKTGTGSFNVIENMRQFGYKGKIFPVNPFADEIAGLPAYRSVREIPEPVALAIVATPREQVPGVVEECAALGVRGAIVVPQGFSDADEKGGDLQEQLTEIARVKGIRILGPNTLGVYDAFSGFTSSFMPLDRTPAPVGVICQSGIFFVGASLFTGWMGKGIDIANACDLDFSEALAHLVEDERIRVIFAHVEGTSRAGALYETARSAAARKPVIAMKTARSGWGVRAASSHSGSLVGDHEVFETAFRQAGVVCAKDPEEALDYTKTFLYLPPMKGNRVAVITFTGAGGIILVDTFEEHGLTLATLSEETLKTARDLSPDWMPIGNPMDIWPAVMKNGMDRVYRAALEAVLQDDHVDGVVCIALAPHLPGEAYLDASKVIQETAAAYPHKPVALWFYGPNQPEIMDRVNRQGTAVAYPTLPRAARALAALHRRYLFFQETRTVPAAKDVSSQAQEILTRALHRGAERLDEASAEALLGLYGIPTAKTLFASTIEETLRKAEEVGYPVALKVSSPTISHKTEAGGVLLDVAGPEALEAGCEAINRTLSHLEGKTDEAGFLIQEMVSGGAEVILGGKRDPQFGPVLVFGQGGIYTEVWRDVARGIAPLALEDARRMIRETRVSRILEGVRGERAYDFEVLCDSLLGLSRLMTDLPLVREVDLNPFKVFEHGGRAVDVRILVGPEAP
jgi:acetate---CoA ligase (ADP-forming)